MYWGISRYRRVLSFPFGRFEQIVFGNLSFPGAVPQVGPPLPRKRSHWIFIQLSEELAFSIGLAFEAQTHKRRYRFAHAGVNRLGIPFDLTGDCGRGADGIWPAANEPRNGFRPPKQKDYEASQSPDRANL
jgi:hypothetical protein